MPALVLGPVLRYVDETEATVWVETDAPCEVEILGCTRRTFHVGGHHYALVHVTGLEPGAATPYEVTLDGERRWPDDAADGFPPSVIRTPSPAEPARIAFGSCRVAVPHEPPYALSKDADPRGREVDALYALALRMRDQPMDEWPSRLVMLGDQVYADEVSPRALDFIRSRRDTARPPGEEVADFEEYTRLYWESWGEPVMRWLLSTVATAMIFDDHDVHDDWNISGSWLDDMRELPWWDERIRGAFSSYWIYQHIGNLSPSHLHDDDDLYAKVCAAEDGADVLRPFAIQADRETGGTRWSFCRDYGGVRVLVVDSRAGRCFADGRRAMVDDREWEWVCERLTGGHDHLVIATTLPFLLGHGLHYLEAWSEAICAGAYGRRFAHVGEKIRRAGDLEHWASFFESFERLAKRIEEVGAGVHGEPPASIVVLSGDVHHAYLAEVAFRREANVKSAVYQAVCSPFRNPLNDRERRVVRFGTSRAGHALARAIARTAGVRDPGTIRWELCAGPWFDNQVATLELHERRAHLRLERTLPDEWRSPRLHECLSRRLA
ncbi:MAG TPA: alkaline phosphatase D family protein [Solirubrobacteraceae bacterium]|nr:alkaline phosphatase D family protein [Solirubrobacteraceae bacterium]